MSHFTCTAESVLKQAKYLFSSEQFNEGFLLLRESFDENDVSDETILSYLKGEIGASVEESDVTFDKDIEVGEEYLEDINSVLADYRNLYRDENLGLLCLDSKVDFIVDHYSAAENNKPLQLLKDSKNRIVSTQNKVLNQFKIATLAEFMLVHDTGIYFLNRNEKMLVSEVSVIHEDINSLLENFNNYIAA